MFDSEGAPILFKEIKANQEYTPSANLNNGMNLKGQSEDMFTAPWSKNTPVEIVFQFGKKYKISMARIWNYWTDKSSWKKGVKLLSFHLEDSLIFAGCIAHCTEGKGVQNRHEFIMFTQDPGIVQKISDHDWLKAILEKEEAEIDELAMKDLKSGMGCQLVSATSTRFRLERNSSRKSKV